MSRRYNAHTPFIPFDDRPVSIDEWSREVRLPHETGVSLTTREHEEAYKAVSMSELMTEANTSICGYSRIPVRNKFCPNG